MARKAINTDSLPGKQKLRERATLNRSRRSIQASVAPLKSTKFRDLTAEQKDELLKVLLLRAGLIAPD